MFGIKTQLKLMRDKRLWRKRNKHNGTEIGSYVFGWDNVSIGAGTYGEINVLTSSANPKLNIGNYCSIAKNVVFIIQDDHPLDYFSTYPWKVRMLGEHKCEALGKGGIIVDDDVWIGFGATILDGVRIARGGSSLPELLSPKMSSHIPLLVVFLQDLSANVSTTKQSIALWNSTSQRLTAHSLKITAGPSMHHWTQLSFVC